MALFRFSSSPPLPETAGEGLLLRPAISADFAEWVALRQASRRFLEPWEPIWPADDLTRAAFRRRVRRAEDEIASDAAYPFLIRRADDNTLLGGLTLGLIRRGVAQSGTLGYWIGEPHAGRGYMTRAVRVMARFAFATLRLRRIEAACVPTNAASIRVLEKVGFVREGLAREYLCIDGVWKDHLLFALLERDLDPPRNRPPG